MEQILKLISIDLDRLANDVGLLQNRRLVPRPEGIKDFLHLLREGMESHMSAERAADHMDGRSGDLVSLDTLEPHQIWARAFARELVHKYRPFVRVRSIFLLPVATFEHMWSDPDSAVLENALFPLLTHSCRRSSEEKVRTSRVKK